MNKLAIVGIFYDGYIDLWRDFIGLIKKNWSSCPYKIYIIDGELDLMEEDTKGLDITVIHAGKEAEYSRKVQVALENIEEQYLLLLLEDFYFVSEVNNLKVDSILNIIEDNNIDYYTMPMPEFIGTKEKEQYKNYSFRKISVNREYIFSCQPSIWNRELLKLCIGNENYNAWIFEGIYAKSECVRTEEFLENKVVDYGNPLCLRHGAIQGKMIPTTLKLIEKSGYQMTTERPALPFSVMVSYSIKKIGHRVVELFKIPQIREIFKSKSILEKYEREIDQISAKIINKEKIDAYLEKNRII